MNLILLRFSQAITYFKKGLEYTDVTGNPSEMWIATICNLGHCHRNLEEYEKSKECFLKVLHTDMARNSSLAALAIISYNEGNLFTAIEYLHQVY